jgi:hypothetical protein
LPLKLSDKERKSNEEVILRRVSGLIVRTGKTDTKWIQDSCAMLNEIMVKEKDLCVL